MTEHLQEGKPWEKEAVTSVRPDIRETDRMTPLAVYSHGLHHALQLRRLEKAHDRVVKQKKRWLAERNAFFEILVSLGKKDLAIATSQAVADQFKTLAEEKKAKKPFSKTVSAAE